MELGSHSRMDFLAAKLFLKSCFSDTVFVTLLCTAVEKAVSEVHKLLRIGRGPTSLTLLFWRRLTVSSVFAGRSARTSYSSHPLPSPPPPPFPIPNQPCGFCGRKAPCFLSYRVTPPSGSGDARPSNSPR